MTIEKISGTSYRITQMYEGKRYRVTVPYKPTHKEAIQLMAEKIDIADKCTDKTSFANCAKEYVEMKKNVLSPRSVREYKLYPARLPSWFIEMPISKIEQADVQRCINELAIDKSPKTVRSLHGFISAVLKSKRKDLVLDTTLPQKVKKDLYIPSKSDVKELLTYTADKQPMFYVPIALASSCGLRRSEILALTVDDIQDGEIYVHSALVEDEDGEWVNKTTKTTSSTRRVPIPKDIEDAIKEQGYVYRGGAQSISNFMKRAQNELQMEEFSLHKLRHFFASQLLTNGVPMKDVQALGGWETDAVLKEVYAHSMQTKTKDDRTALTKSLWESIL